MAGPNGPGDIEWDCGGDRVLGQGYRGNTILRLGVENRGRESASRDGAKGRGSRNRTKEKEGKEKMVETNLAQMVATNSVQLVGTLDQGFPLDWESDSRVWIQVAWGGGGIRGGCKQPAGMVRKDREGEVKEGKNDTKEPSVSAGTRRNALAVRVR